MAKVHNSPYVMNSFLEQFSELVTARGGKFEALCNQAGLPVEMALGRHQLIPFDKFIALLEAADETLGYPEIAFDLAGRQSIDTIGPVTQLIRSCETFEHALIGILDYLEVLTSGFTIRYISHPHFLELQFDVFMPGLNPRRQFQNYLVASTVSVIRHIAKSKCHLRGCFFTRSEPDTRLRTATSEFFECPVAYDAEKIKITMDRTILSEPIALDSEILRREILGHKPSRKEIEAELTTAICLSLVSGRATLKNTALAMGYSERTFRRRLASVGLVFGHTLRAVRFEQAIRYLQSTHYTLSDISALLGYANQSAFTRSFQQWSGMTPSQYRNGLIQGQ